MNAPSTVYLLPDFTEEGWPSMDLVNTELFGQFARDPSLDVRQITTNWVWQASSPQESRAGWRFKADRLVNRMWRYPRQLRSHADPAAVYHVLDHSYAHLVHHLPTARCVVTCHDLDTFGSILRPRIERRGPLFRAMTRRIWTGLLRAAHVACDSNATREDLLRHAPELAGRSSVVRLGVSPGIGADAEADQTIEVLLGAPSDRIDLLHVGSTIPRKRIDVLLRVFAALRREIPAARLLRVGGALTDVQNKLARELGIEGDIVILPRLSWREVSAVYRRAAILLLTSEREGFGLPLLEALACGTPVVATDLPVLREVGGDVVRYALLEQTTEWVRATLDLLQLRGAQPELWRQHRANAITQAGRYTWAETARQYAALYRRIAEAA